MKKTFLFLCLCLFLFPTHAFAGNLRGILLSALRGDEIAKNIIVSRLKSESVYGESGRDEVLLEAAKLAGEWLEVLEEDGIKNTEFTRGSAEGLLIRLEVLIDEVIKERPYDIVLKKFKRNLQLRERKFDPAAERTVNINPVIKRAVKGDLDAVQELLDFIQNKEPGVFATLIRFFDSHVRNFNTNPNRKWVEGFFRVLRFLYEHGNIKHASMGRMLGQCVLILDRESDWIYLRDILFDRTLDRGAGGEALKREILYAMFRKNSSFNEAALRKLVSKPDLLNPKLAAAIINVADGHIKGVDAAGRKLAKKLSADMLSHHNPEVRRVAIAFASVDENDVQYMKENGLYEKLVNISFPDGERRMAVLDMTPIEKRTWYVEMERNLDELKTVDDPSTIYVRMGYLMDAAWQLGGEYAKKAFDMILQRLQETNGLNEETVRLYTVLVMFLDSPNSRVSPAEKNRFADVMRTEADESINKSENHLIESMYSLSERLFTPKSEGGDIPEDMAISEELVKIAARNKGEADINPFTGFMAGGNFKMMDLEYREKASLMTLKELVAPASAMRDFSMSREARRRIKRLKDIRGRGRPDVR